MNFPFMPLYILSIQKSSRHDDIEINVEAFSDYQDNNFYDPFVRDLEIVEPFGGFSDFQDNYYDPFLDNYYDPFLRDLYHKKLLENIQKSPTNTIINSIICPELQNHTFTNEKPFDILGLPNCGDLINMEMKLYLDDANSSECWLDSYYLPNNQTTNCLDLLKKSVHEGKTKKVMVITHGFLNR